ncbi:MAG: hypothetical protein NC078_10475, partial [Ruminococcus sp.]|nr:hypothetical protein [Ruminococcus sp.]
MSGFLNLQALCPGQVGSGVNAGNGSIGGILAGLGAVSGEDGGMPGGFGAVLGAVMAESSSGVGSFAGEDVTAEVSGMQSVTDSPMAENAVSTANPDNVNSVNVTEGDIEADKAAKALAELYGALESLGEETPDVMFTAEGAKAVISLLERYISQGNVPEGEIDELFKGVLLDEKQAYADILGAIAMGNVMLPDSEGEMFEADSGDMLEFVTLQAGKLALKSLSVKNAKDSKGEEEAASYVMSVFIAPGISFDLGNEQATVPGEKIETADTDIAADVKAVYGENSGNVPGGEFGGVSAMSAGDNAAVDTADGLPANAFALGNETAQKAVETFTETVSEILSEG